jgi:hypothetical protein
VVLATAGFAYMASNTVDQSNAGEGAAVVSGYHVYNIDYAGVPAVGNPTGSTGTMQWTGTPTVGGISQQDGVTTISFQLDPDNAHWAAIQLYNASGAVVGGGGASNCTEDTIDSSPGVWTCRVWESGQPVPVNEISYIDVEAAQ